MQSEPGAAAPETRRLHPISLLFTISQQAKNLLLPGIVILVVASSGSRGGELWIMLAFIPAVIAALFQYISYRYRFDRDELIVRQGIVFRSERHIPYARIQNIDLVQNPLHRAFSVAEVRIETAGGQKPEAIMRVLSLEAVEHMRGRVFAGAAGKGGGCRRRSRRRGAGARARLDDTARDVFLFGVISNKGMVVIAAMLGVVWQADLFDRWASSLSRESLERYRHLLPRDNPLTAVLLAIGALILALILMRVLSVAWAFAKFHGFRLTRRGDDLRAEYGFLPSVSKTIPRRRIQVLSTREGFLHRRFGRVAVQIETAGSAGEEHGASTDRLWLAPLMSRSDVEELVRDVLPDADFERLDWKSISPRARRRLFRIALYVSAIVTGLAVWGLGPWALTAALLLVPLGWLNAKLYHEHTAYALAPGAVLFRSGWWNRQLSVARFGKIQSVQWGETPFDRRHRMASVRVDTAGATRIAHSVDIRYLDAEVASGLMGQLYDEAGRAEFRW